MHIKYICYLLIYYSYVYSCLWGSPDSRHPLLWQWWCYCCVHWNFWRISERVSSKSHSQGIKCQSNLLLMPTFCLLPIVLETSEQWTHEWFDSQHMLVLQVGQNTTISLARRCRNLESLDLSWCRHLPDEALGLIADSCLSLKLLKLFGCTQVHISLHITFNCMSLLCFSITIGS